MVIFIPNQYATPLRALLLRAPTDDPAEQAAAAVVAAEIAREQMGTLYQKWTREQYAPGGVSDV